MTLYYSSRVSPLSGQGAQMDRDIFYRCSVFSPSQRISETCTECCISSLGGQCSVRPSRAIRQPPGPQTTPETPQGPPWSVSLGCVGGYGPHQHGLQASKKGTGKDTWCHRGRVWLTVRVRPGRGRREKGREWSKRRTGRLRARRAPPSLILAAHTTLHSDIQLQLPDRTSTCGTA